MLFSSITFLYYFLPAVLVIYYLAPAKVKNLILFLASFVFYLWGEPKYSVLLLFSVAVGYMGGRCIEYQRQKKCVCAADPADRSGIHPPRLKSGIRASKWFPPKFKYHRLAVQHGP